MDIVTDETNISTINVLNPSTAFREGDLILLQRGEVSYKLEYNNMTFNDNKIIVTDSITRWGTVNQALTIIGSKLDNLEQLTSDNNNYIVALQLKDSQLEPRITANETDINTLTPIVNQNASDIGILQGKVSTNETDINTLQSGLSTNDGITNSNTNTINSLNDVVNGMVTNLNYSSNNIKNVVATTGENGEDSIDTSIDTQLYDALKKMREIVYVPIDHYDGDVDLTRTTIGSWSYEISKFRELDGYGDVIDSTKITHIHISYNLFKDEAWSGTHHLWASYPPSVTPNTVIGGYTGSGSKYDDYMNSGTVAVPVNPSTTNLYLTLDNGHDAGRINVSVVGVTQYRY